MRPEAASALREVASRAELRDSVDLILAGWADQRPDLDFSSMAVVTRLARVHAHLQAGLQQVFARFDLTGADFQVIVHLRRAGAPYRMPQTRLTSQLALTSGTVSLRVDRLVRRGLVVREPDDADQRSQLVRLTAEGLRLFDEVAPVHLANEDRLLSALTRDERATLDGLLRRTLGAFENSTIEVGRPLGMRLETAHIARERRAAVGLSDVPGLLVTDTMAGAPAAEAGLMRGDLLVAVNGREVRCAAALAEAIDAAPRGRLRFSMLRGDTPTQVTVQMPASSPHCPDRDSR
jgi:DNA-binding MarR family transcriptional regulator